MSCVTNLTLQELIFRIRVFCRDNDGIFHHKAASYFLDSDGIGGGVGVYP